MESQPAAIRLINLLLLNISDPRTAKLSAQNKKKVKKKTKKHRAKLNSVCYPRIETLRVLDELFLNCCMSIRKSPWEQAGSCRARSIEFWRRFKKESTSSIAFGTRCFCCSSRLLSEIHHSLAMNSDWIFAVLLFRFMIPTMRTRKKNLRPTWKRRLRSCRGIETRSRHGYSPARSRIKRYDALWILLNFAVSFFSSPLFLSILIF